MVPGPPGREPGELRLTITASEEAREAADFVFEQFVARGAIPDCGCVSQASPIAVSPAKPARPPRGECRRSCSADLEHRGDCLRRRLCASAGNTCARSGRRRRLLATMMGVHPLLVTLATAAVTAARVWVGWAGLRSRMWQGVSTLCLMALEPIQFNRSHIRMQPDSVRTPVG
jgi:hypothetical protein